MKENKTLRFRLLLIGLLLVFSVISICLGAKQFSLKGLFTGNADDFSLLVISRLPRLLSIIITGAGLSIAGLIMQTITGNKFVSPSTAGTMEWCRLGVMIAILLAGSQAKFTKITIAFLVSLIGTLLFTSLLKRIPYKNPIMVPLIGMMLGNVVSSITTFFSYKYDIIQNMSSWLQGNFSLVIKGNYEILYIGIPFLLIAYLYAGKFTIAGMGESFATNLGLNHKWIVTTGLIIVSFLTSTIVVTIGSISFIGLIVPNVIALIRGDNLKNTLFDTALVGALFVLICDILGRSILYPFEVSVSVVASVLGSIIFLFILFKKKG